LRWTWSGGEGRAIAEAVLAGRALDHPGRVHIVALMYEFVFSYFEMIALWARWAEEEVRSWPDTTATDDLERTVGVFRRALERSAGLRPGPGA